MRELVTDMPELTANEMLMAKDMAETLHQHYPGHLWAVHVDSQGGMADVRNLMLSGTHGYRLRLPANYSASEFKTRVIKAGGEILERFAVVRGMANDDALADMKTDFAGRVIGDLSQ